MLYIRDTKMKPSTKKLVKKGAKIEAEHKDVIDWVSNYLKSHKKLPPRKAIYGKIAMSHIKEDRRYYSKLAKMEGKK